MFRIIGEKINGTRKRVRAAIEERDRDFIGSLAQRQADAGAHWIDVNAGTHPDREVEDLAWLVETVQARVDRPLCLDSPNPPALAAAVPLTRQPPLINSISGEPVRREAILQLVQASGASVIALAVGAGGMPVTVEDRLAVLHELVATTRAAGIADDRVYLDPLVMTIATNTESAVMVLETIRQARAAFPQAHVSCGLSNMSFGLPARGLINRTFLALAVSAGLDTAIVDPLDRELMAALLTTELLLGRDRHCLAYTRAYRSGLLDGGSTSGAPT
ncbi:MAG: dihydropteroate synthase [Chloroflexi bacterium]|nr:dihydropteroate synthase [Chloroflexota bacterium]